MTQMTTSLSVIVPVLVATLCAQEQVPQTRPGWPCVAGKAVDPVYLRTAEATGGQVFLFDRSEAARAMMLVGVADKYDDTIFRSTGTLSTGLREFTVPVDSTVESLMLSVTLQCLQSITVYRPSNTEVRAGEPNVNDNQFRSGKILLLARPEAGAWRFKITGVGMFFVVAQAKSSISLDRVEFVEKGGRIGHEGLFPVKSALHLGERRQLSVSVTAPAGGKTFRLINSAGETLEPLGLRLSDESEDETEFLGTVTLKHSAFRVTVEGRDAAGYPYQRVLPKLIQIEAAN